MLKNKCWNKLINRVILIRLAQMFLYMLNVAHHRPDVGSDWMRLQWLIRKLNELVTCLNEEIQMEF